MTFPDRIYVVNFLLVFANLGLICSSALAQGAASNSINRDELAGFQFNIDNDLFILGHTDRWYTNGLRLAWAYNQDPQTLVAKTFFDLSKQLLVPGEKASMGYSIGHAMYSPRDIRNPAPQASDRPWAGFLYFGLTAQSYQGPRFSATELKLGVTGKPALGEDLQTWWHAQIRSARPAGWDNQVTARPAFQLSYASLTRDGNFWGDRLGFQHGWGAAAGNLRVYGNVNASVILGDLRGTDTPILVANEGDFMIHDVAGHQMSKRPFGFLSIGVNAVAYNYFITGPTPYVNDVETMPLSTSAQIGFSVPLKRWFPRYGPRVIYTANVRTSEFKTISTGQFGGVQRWGSLTFNWDF